MKVAVLGGGPAAGAAAWALARGGVATTLLRPPGRPEKPCGGGVPGSVLGELPGVDLDALPSVAPRAVLLEARPATLRTELAGLRIFRRRDLDAAIVAAAERAGVRVVDASAAGLAEVDGGVEVRTVATAERFDLVVGADGARGLSRRFLGLRPEGDSIGIGASLDGVASDELVLSFPDVVDAYLWIFPRPGGVSVGVGYDAARGSAGLGRALLDAFLARHVPGAAAHPGPRYRYPIPVWGPWTLRSVAAGLRRRILLVGDAAAVADPLTREGIRWSIRSALWAAGSILAGIPDAYRERLGDELGPEMDRATRAADRFFDDRLAQAMVPVARLHGGIRRVLADLLAGQQPYRGLRRRLLRAAVGRDAPAVAAQAAPRL